MWLLVGSVYGEITNPFHQTIQLFKDITREEIVHFMWHWIGNVNVGDIACL